MKIVRFKAAGKTRYGVLDGTHIVEYAGTPYGTFRKARKRWQVKQAVLLAPVVPTKIVALALNYREHAEEMHLNDLTARDIELRDHRQTRAKAFDTFCPIGPCISTDIDPNSADVETWVNGERRQAGNTKSFVFPVEDMVARVSAVMTLLAGDVIATGTPAGVGPLQPGDRVEVRIDGIGSLKNPVIKLQEA